MSAMTIVAADARPNHRAAAPTPAGALRVSTTTRLMDWPLAIGTGLGTNTGRPRQPAAVAAHGLVVEELLRLDIAHAERAGQRDGLVGADRFVHVERVVERAVVADPDHRLAL